MAALRILLGNGTLSLLAGTETWTYTLATKLKQSGHHVECFSPVLGAISDQLTQQQIVTHRRFSKRTRFFARLLPRWKYDVIIANHLNVANYLRYRFPRTPMISTVHGIIHKTKDIAGNEIKAPEHPAIDARVDQFVSVSEEVQAVLKRDFALESIIIRNFFDLDTLRPTGPPSPEPRQILFNSNYNQSTSPEVEIARQVAQHYGARFMTVGLNHGSSSNIKKLIDESDIVIGLGRSVLEGVAMGRLGLVHGHWGTGGVVCRESVEELRHCNFSGRNAKGQMMSTKQIIALLDRQYNVQNFEWGMAYVRQEHNASDATDKYLQLAKKLIGHK